MTDDGGVLTIHAGYRKMLEAAAARAAHEHRLDPRPGFVRVDAASGSTILAVLVDPAGHVIHAAAYSNPTGPIARGLLETLCDILIGLPVQEAADHAAIRVEFVLRDRSQPRPVSGIVMPGNDGPFQLLRELTRRLARRYVDEAGVHTTENFFEPLPSPTWSALTPQTRVSKVQQVLDELTSGVPDGALTVVRIDDFVRVTIAPVAGRVTPHQLMALERELKARLEPHLHVYLEELKDRNVIRRILSPKEMANVRND